MNMGEAMRKSKEKAVNIVVVKIDNEAKDIWKRIREMPSVDYHFILKGVDRIVNGLDFMKPVSEKEDGID